MPNNVIIFILPWILHEIANNNCALIWMCLVIVKVNKGIKTSCRQGYNQLPQQGGTNLNSNVLHDANVLKCHSNIIICKLIRYIHANYTHFFLHLTAKINIILILNYL